MMSLLTPPPSPDIGCEKTMDNPHGIFQLPEPVLVQIFSLLPLTDMWQVARACKAWHAIATDSYLYRDIQLDGLEMTDLITQLRKLSNVATRIRKIDISACYSKFIQSTVIPVTFATSSPNVPTLYTHIMTLQPTRRKQEYERLGYHLHEQFSDALLHLMKKNQDTLRDISIQKCNLDLEMTELAFGIMRYGSKLEGLTYLNNRDNGFNSAEVLTGIIAACPNMRRFRGYYFGIDEKVILSVAKYWPNLESFSLYCTNGSLHEYNNLNSSSQPPTLTPQGLKSDVLWKLLTSCTSLKQLELIDLACINNDTLSNFVKQMRHDSNQNLGTSRYQPYKSHYQNRLVKCKTQYHKAGFGFNLESLRIVKYTTTPLTSPGFENILALFPNIKHLRYETNYTTFDNLYEGVTPRIFEQERKAIEHLFDSGNVRYEGEWHMPVITEQRLMAGLSSLSN